jgi:HEAT repeat protein
LPASVTIDRAAGRIIAKFDRAAVPLLMIAATDLSRPRVRKWSLQALGVIADKKAAPLLVKALKDERMTVRLHALLGLAKMKHGPAAIRRLLKDPSGGIRVNAIDALAKLKDKASGPALIIALTDEQWYVRQHAARACGERKAEGSSGCSESCDAEYKCCTATSAPDVKNKNRKKLLSRRRN